MKPIIMVQMMLISALPKSELSNRLAKTAYSRACFCQFD
jgi:hypothetical protein